MISSILTKTRSINDSKKKGCQRLYECVPQKCTLLFLNNVVSNNDFYSSRSLSLSPQIPYVKHSLKPDGSCCCGDTGCDGPSVHVMVESSSVCSSSKIPPISQVTPT